MVKRVLLYDNEQPSKGELFIQNSTLFSFSLIMSIDKIIASATNNPEHYFEENLEIIKYDFQTGILTDNFTSYAKECRKSEINIIIEKELLETNWIDKFKIGQRMMVVLEKDNVKGINISFKMKNQ